MKLLIPTPHELARLESGPLPAILRPMEPPVEHAIDMELNGGEWFRCLEDMKYHDNNNIPSWKAPFAPGDVIVWQQEWQRVLQKRPRACPKQLMEKGFEWDKQPASTMPVKLASFRSTVVECRPARVSALPSESCEQLGFRRCIPSYGPYVDLSRKERPDLVYAKGEFLHDWQTNYPSHPFDSSWAWWIELKTQKGETNDDS